MLPVTSLVFGTNAVHAFYKHKLFYAGLFILLMTTSVIWHSSPKLEQTSMPAFWMDQAAIVAVAIMTIYYAWAITGIPAAALAVLLAVAVYLGYSLCAASWSRSYPFEHGALHIVTSLCGHVVLGQI